MTETLMECVDCKKGWTLSQNEVDFFRRMNLRIPRRCKPCRGTRRAMRTAEAVAPATYDSVKAAR
jgi:hypothetical protein